MCQFFIRSSSSVLVKHIISNILIYMLILSQYPTLLSMFPIQHQRHVSSIKSNLYVKTITFQYVVNTLSLIPILARSKLHLGQEQERNNSRRGGCHESNRENNCRSSSDDGNSNSGFRGVYIYRPRRHSGLFVPWMLCLDNCRNT